MEKSGLGKQLKEILAEIDDCLDEHQFDKIDEQKVKELKSRQQFSTDEIEAIKKLIEKLS